MDHKIFIDGGAHTGESIKKFREFWPDHQEYKIHSFEPNEAHRQILRGLLRPQDVYHSQALWNENTWLNFYGTEETRSGYDVGCTTAPEKNDISHNHPVRVQAIDFSSWIKENFLETDFIILKLDIEGSEYRVLNKMLDDGSLDFINRLYVEFHHQWMTISKEEHNILIERLKKHGTHPYFWDAISPTFDPREKEK